MASYIERSLGDGETIIARAHFHWLYSLGAWAALLIPGAAFLAFLSQTWTGAGNGAGLILTGVLFLAGFWTFAKMMIRKLTTEIGVTGHRFVEKYGLVSMHTNEIALPNIEGVRVTQNFLGRIFGYGVVRIEGTGMDAVTTPNIADPVGFVRAIQTAKEHQASRA